MSLKPAQREVVAADLRLEPFDPADAGLVVSWVRTEREAYWFAPKTTPPITAADIRRWRSPGHEPLQLVRAGGSSPLGYGELNVLSGARGHYWLGHLIVDPTWRGQGLGRALTRLLLWRAFGRYRARKVSLIVFPDNECAIACYRAAGMAEDGIEEHELEPYGVRVALLRMAATRAG